MDTFDVAEQAASALARQLQHEGHDMGAVADAFVAAALAAFSAHHGMPETARGLAALWANLRGVVEHG